MLILSRKIGERILIGDSIIITVTDYHDGKVRIGIQAPRDVPVYRSELMPYDPARKGQPSNQEAGK